MEALDVTNRIGPPFDVVTRLKDSWESGHLICVVPWLVEYLKMTKRDTITRSTGTFKIENENVVNCVTILDCNYS